MELIGISLPLVAWIPIFTVTVVLAVTVFTVVAVVVAPVIEFFFGKSARSNFELVAEKPIWLLWLVGDAIRSVIAIPWRLHRKTLFTEVFGFRSRRLFSHRVFEQENVDMKLAELAGDYWLACIQQEEARERTSGYSGPVDLLQFDARVAVTKSKFWRAHNLAQHLGFEVLYSHKAYLTEEQCSQTAA